MTAVEQSGEVPLCVSCAMCCDGTLFRRARIYDGEEGSIRDAGLEVIDDVDKKFFRLPCQYNQCGACQIYESRFEVCRTFFCALYKRQERGEITLEEAKSVVRTALELRARVVEAEPAARSQQHRHDLRNRLADQLASTDSEERRAIGVRMIDLIALDTYLDRHFREPETQEEGRADPAPNS